MGNTISENKATALTLGTVAATALGGYLFYKQYKSEQPDQQEELKVLEAVPKKNKVDIRSQITYFKSQIDSNNPTLEDIKQLFRILSTHVKVKTLEVSEKFRTERRKRFAKDRRFNDVVEYFRYSIEGIMALQKKVMELQGEQTELLGLAGISQGKFAQYAAQLGPFMQELIFSSDVSLEDLKRSLEIKTEYLQTHGQRLFQILIELSATLTLQQKQHIPIFLNIVMSDEAFENDPALDKQQFDMAYEKYKNELGEEMTKLEQVLMPLMQKLQTALIGDQMGGMGGYGGGYPDQGFGDYDQMGGMGMNEQMMMQQLEQLRIADPQAYEQLMMMMQAQAGMGR